MVDALLKPDRIIGGYPVHIHLQYRYGAIKKNTMHRNGVAPRGQVFFVKLLLSNMIHIYSLVNV